MRYGFAGADHGPEVFGGHLQRYACRGEVFQECAELGEGGLVGASGVLAGVLEEVAGGAGVGAGVS